MSMAAARRSLKRVSLEQATTIVRSYFVRNHGTYGAIGFVVDEAQDDGSSYLVRCSFWTALGQKHKTPYEVTVDKASGEITSVKKKRGP